MYLANNKGNFLKAKTCVFDISIGGIEDNEKQIIHAIKQAQKEFVHLLVFPELCLTGYTSQDWFLRQEFLNRVEESLCRITKYVEAGMLCVVGAPIRNNGLLFNCAVVFDSHGIIAVIPKTYIPNYGEYYEDRWFASASDTDAKTVRLLENGDVPFGTDILIASGPMMLACEICEDVWMPVPPSSVHTMNGANIIACLSASNEVATKKQYRRDLIRMQSARCNCGYVYASAGAGESTSDLVYSGHQMVVSCGSILAETCEPDVGSSACALIDMERVEHDRMMMNSRRNWKCHGSYRIIQRCNCLCDEWPEHVNAYPFVPADKAQRSDRCMEILHLQASGLATRLRKTGIKKTVIGISGGLDSTLALLVVMEAYRILGIGMDQCICVTMPGFGTSSKTLGYSMLLMSLCGATSRSVDIRAACSQHLQDIGHDADNYDIAYENAQARERTQILMDIANMENALVIGTGDMSELALGWCTYNGDHMSMYAVNASVPKTLVKFMVETYAEMSDDKELKKVLNGICGMVISPELLPPGEEGEMQSTEQTIGKYDLHDFFLYYYVRFGFSEWKILKLAMIAFPNVSEDEIKNTLHTFVTRFEKNQFKRNCMPDGPKVGTVSLSPRGDWRMPSDMSAVMN